MNCRRFLVVALLACALACLAGTVRGGKDDLPNPGWDWSCKTPFRVCSKVEVYRYWGEHLNERMTVAVDGITNDVNNKDIVTVWLLMDDPDIELAKELSNAEINVMVVYPRGTKSSTTHYACSDTTNAHTDQCWVNEKCAADLATRATAKENVYNASHFMMDQVVHDLDWLLRTLGDGRRNVVLAQGLSSTIALRLLQYHPQNPAAVLLMDYVHPTYFDTYGYLAGEGHDAALQHLLTMCDDDVKCVGRLGASEGVWSRLQKLRSLAQSNKLTCAKKLKWSGNKLWGASFADQFRSVLSSMLRYPTYPFVASKTDLTALIPAMLYRLQRCNEKDVTALNKLYTYLTDPKGFTCPDDVYLHTLWLANEFVQTTPPKNVDKYWSGEAGGRGVLPAAAHISAFQAGAAKFPKVAHSQDSRLLPENTTQRVLLIAADVDPLTPRGAASRVAVTFKKLDSSVKALQMRGIANQPAAYLTPCIINNVRFYKVHGEWAEPDQCTVDAKKRIDFLAGPSKDYFGTSDAWDFDVPNSDDGSSRGGGGGGGSGGGVGVLKKILRGLLILIVVVAIGAGCFYGYQYYKAHGFRYGRVSDNFYDNLHA